MKVFNFRFNKNMEWKKDIYTITDDSQKFDLESIYQFLTNSYWAKGRSKELIQESIRHSLALGMFNNKEQIGFARVITDYCTFAYLCDVYVIESY